MSSVPGVRLEYIYGEQLVTLEGPLLQLADQLVDIEIIIEEDQPGKRIKIWLTAASKVKLKSFKYIFEEEYPLNSRIFCNGIQSWSETRQYQAMESQKGLRKMAYPIMKPYGDYSFYEYKGKPGVLRSWLYTYIKQPGQKIRFWGALNDSDAYTCFQHRTADRSMAVIKEVEGWEVEGKVLLADWWEAETSEFAAFSHWYSLLDIPPLRGEPATGWTSWYHYYTGITEQIMLQNLSAFEKEKIPIDFFQLDDGYQQALGDWLKINKKFPSGMRSLAGKIREAGYKPGIWLAPLAAEKKSDLFQQHPEWIVKNEKGQPLKIGFNPLWSGAFYALDIYHTGVRDYLKLVFDTIFKDWGFEMVKLDFLYGAALIPRNGKTRGRIMQDTMDFLRECAGDKFILGCGVPLSAALKTTDYCRIGQDVHLGWEFGLLKWCRNQERVSTYLALTNTINRRQMSGKFFWNDPDVFMLRRKKQNLSPEEQYTLLLVNMLFGDLLFTSDLISDYDAETMRLYKSVFPLFPRKEQRVEQGNDLYKITFRIHDHFYTALVNLSNESMSFKLPPGKYFDNRTAELIGGEQMIIIPPHHSHCFMHIAYTPFALAGTRGHFFSGAEVKDIRLESDQIILELQHDLIYSPEVFIKTPPDAGITAINGKPVTRIPKTGFDILSAQL